MEINENAPGNISQGGVTSGTDNETGFDRQRDAGKPPLAEEEVDQLEGHELIEPREPGVDLLSDNQSEVPLSPNDDIDEDMADVDINNLVSDEHPDSR
ncbi:MAG: hypothetical protein JWR17_5164 [Pseudomonas sp.]|jgi:hypothetical protein|uniref:hypothetical protein n=1 Tax=Pseudomonas sp. TaxID=306 RepID=UPI00263A1403|nr:hypothetical protein [Pseudomonas sp.]MDB6052418.1 hypothetical protein [Pseudomonas sp.]